LVAVERGALVTEETMSVDRKVLRELLCQALATETGGVEIYETAVQCARNPKLKKEWKKYLDQTRRHKEVVEGLCGTLDIDPSVPTTGSKIVTAIGKTLVDSMRAALASGDAATAEIVAGECVVLAETKDHLNWKLLTECGKKLTGEAKAAVEKAVDEVEDEEDEHLYHSAGWTRELWLEALGVGGVLPPPEE
jgi:rubrerythrin